MLVRALEAHRFIYRLGKQPSSFSLTHDLSFPACRAYVSSLRISSLPLTGKPGTAL